MKEYKISEKFRDELIQHFRLNYNMAKIEETVNRLRNLPEIKVKEIT